MQKYRSKASSKVRIDFGAELIEGLKMFPETAALAPTLEAQNAKLDSLCLAREQKERVLVPLRARVRFGNFAFDRAVRAASRAAEIQDGGTRGMLHKAIFGDSITTIVAPAGQPQVTVGTAFIERVTASNAPGIDAWRTESLPKIETALTSLATACDDRKNAYQQVASARVAEDVARDDHELLIDKLMGEVRAIFPKDRDRWSVIFPKVSRSSSDPDPTPDV